MSAYLGEAQLLGWSESHNAGAKLTLALPEPEDLAPFRTMTVKKGKAAGQILACLVVEMRDGEDPIAALQRGLASGIPMSMLPPKQEPVQVGPLCKLAAMWCRREDFQLWAAETYGDRVSPVPMDREEFAKQAIYEVCGINSRRLLDTDDFARHSFNEYFRIPFSRWLENEQHREAA